MGLILAYCMAKKTAEIPIEMGRPVLLPKMMIVAAVHHQT